MVAETTSGSLPIEAHENMSTRIFVVEDEPTVRRGLELLLKREPGWEVCGYASKQSDALKQILQLRPDLAIIDLTLEEGSGLELIRELRAFGATLRVLVFSMHTQTSNVRTAMRMGADGYVTKEEGAESLTDAIRVLMQGKPFLTEAMVQRVGKSAAELQSARPKPGR
jgi:DNA-binding NarL/FixJ family response regulator